jgi:hypothetical protein
MIEDNKGAGSIARPVRPSHWQGESVDYAAAQTVLIKITIFPTCAGKLKRSRG